MAVLSTWGHQGAPISWDKGVQVFGNAHHPFGLDVLYGHSKTWQADAVITLLDTWVFDVNALRGLKWIPWYPVDTEPMPAIIKNNLERAWHIIGMSKYGVEQAQLAGLESDYAPCAIDTNVYQPTEQKRAREKIAFPKDKFIVGMVAMNKGNPSRKAFHQTIEAFAALKKKHSDVALYLHTLDGVNGQEMVNLPALCDVLGLKYAYAYTPDVNDADVIFADGYRYALGYPPEAMASIYSALDVHVLVTLGEGFGIPIIEAQACGTPVIVGDWTSMPELCFSGWKVDKKDTIPIFTNLSAYHYLPNAGAIAEQMENAYQAKGKSKYRKNARKGAMAYDADAVYKKYWKPIMKRIEEKLGQPEAPANLSKNLDVLR